MQITNPRSQQERVIAICSDGIYRTLEQIQKEIKQKFNQFDTTPAISARLRNNSALFKHGYVKDKFHKQNAVTKKLCYFYTLKKAVA